MQGIGQTVSICDFGSNVSGTGHQCYIYESHACTGSASAILHGSQILCLHGTYCNLMQDVPQHMLELLHFLGFSNEK
jgi:hypothetical protein